MRQSKEKETGTVATDWFVGKDGTECDVRDAHVDADAIIGAERGPWGIGVDRRLFSECDCVHRGECPEG